MNKRQTKLGVASASAFALAYSIDGKMSRNDEGAAVSDNYEGWLYHFLQPACEQRRNIQNQLDELGFRAGQLRTQFFEEESESGERIVQLLSLLAPKDICLEYVDKIAKPLRLKGSVMPEVSELKNELIHSRVQAWDDALLAEWAQFRSEANALENADVVEISASHSRQEIFKKVTQACVKNIFGHMIVEPKNHIRKWVHHPNWVDAAYRLLSIDSINFIVTFETPRPLRVGKRYFSDFEPSLIGTTFDQTQVSLWAIPDQFFESGSGNYFEILYATLGRIYPAYWQFNSARGLIRIADAHLTLIRLILDTCVTARHSR